MEIGTSKVNGNSSRDERPKHVDCHGGFAGASEANPEKVPWMNSLPATFTLRFDTFRNLVPVVIQAAIVRVGKCLRIIELDILSIRFIHTSIPSRHFHAMLFDEGGKNFWLKRPTGCKVTNNGRLRVGYSVRMAKLHGRVLPTSHRVLRDLGEG